MQQIHEGGVIFHEMLWENRHRGRFNNLPKTKVNELLWAECFSPPDSVLKHPAPSVMVSGGDWI